MMSKYQGEPKKQEKNQQKFILYLQFLLCFLEFLILNKCGKFCSTILRSAKVTFRPLINPNRTASPFVDYGAPCDILYL